MRSLKSVLLSFAFLALVLSMPACRSATPEPELPAETASSPAPEPESVEASAPEPAEEPEAAEETACAGGVIKDDGSVETGYGYVPSAVMGVYLQRFHSEEFPSRELSEVCVCWLRTREDDDLDFEVVFYEDEGGRPAGEPYAKVASTADEVPKGVEAAGRFYSVDVSGVTLAEGASYIGVHWNPSRAQFVFVCTDTSQETEYVTVFSAEDRAPAWTDIKTSRDPIFKPHRAILLRARSAE